MDIMGTAMHAAFLDVKYIIGFNHSDNEETAENDEEYQNMSNIKDEHTKKGRRRNSDESVNSNY